MKLQCYSYKWYGLPKIPQLLSNQFHRDDLLSKFGYQLDMLNYLLYIYASCTSPDGRFSGYERNMKFTLLSAAAFSTARTRYGPGTPESSHSSTSKMVASRRHLGALGLRTIHNDTHGF